MARPREADQMLVLQKYNKKMDHFAKQLQNPQWGDNNTLKYITEKESPGLPKELREQLGTRFG